MASLDTMDVSGTIDGINIVNAVDCIDTFDGVDNINTAGVIQESDTNRATLQCKYSYLLNRDNSKQPN